MHFRFRSTLMVVAAGFAVAACSFSSSAQQAATGMDAVAPAASAPAQISDALPNAPAAQSDLAGSSDSQSAQAQSAQQPANEPDPTAAGGSSPTGGVTQTQQTGGQNSEHQKAEQQIKEEEHQRVEGIVPDFNVTYHHNAVPLTAGQKMNLSLHSAIDPFAFASAFAESGYHEAANDLKGFPWGPKGYFERSGAAYLDTFDSDIFSTGIFPVIFREDPRYFRMGPGRSIKRRILYSLATNFIAKRDYNGKWGPNYGNLLGNFAAGELSQLYYPAGNSGTGLAFTGAVIQIGLGAGGSIFNEFWPDLSRKFLHKDPTRGLDAQAAQK